MTNGSTALERSSNPFDDWKSYSVAIIMALVGYTVMGGAPVLSTALVAKAGFTEVEVGRIWGADMGGLSLGAILSAFLVGRVNRRHLVLAGVALCIGANAMCLIMVSFDQLLILRLVAGIASGIFTGVAVATIGGATRPVNIFSLEMLSFAFVTALLLYFLPKLSMNEIYILFIILAALCALLVRWIPTRPSNASELAQQEQATEETVNWNPPKILPIICLIACCFTYINLGSYYTYIELAALADGVAQSWITPVLTWASIFGLVGCVIAYFAYRFGLFKPLFVALIALIGSVIMVSTGINDFNIVISVFSFLALWTFIDIYQSSMLAHMDRTGSLVALLPAVQGFGQFVGPNIAASVLGADYSYGTMFVVCSSMTLVALVLYIGVLTYMRKRSPGTL